MQIGYARVSAHEKNLALQETALKKAGCEKILIDKVSSIAAARPGIDEAISLLKEGDTFVVWRLDRPGRSLKHLIEMVSRLKEKKIGFKSLQDSIDTTCTEGKPVSDTFNALAEFERHLIIERAQTGLAAAKARGRKGGRPKSLSKKERQIALNLYNDRKTSIKEICNKLKISKPTLYKYIKEGASN